MECSARMLVDLDRVEDQRIRGEFTVMLGPVADSVDEGTDAGTMLLRCHPIIHVPYLTCLLQALMKSFEGTCLSC